MPREKTKPSLKSSYAKQEDGATSQRGCKKAVAGAGSHFRTQNLHHQRLTARWQWKQPSFGALNNYVVLL